MANSPGTGFTQGDFMAKMELFINDPNNTTNPLTSILSCLPNCTYTNTDVEGIQLSLDQIKLESINFESKRLYNYAVYYSDMLEKVMCIGEDACILFGGFIESVKYFIETYSQLTPILETDVNQNPNYYNN